MNANYYKKETVSGTKEITDSYFEKFFNKEGQAIIVDFKSIDSPNDQDYDRFVSKIEGIVSKNYFRFIRAESSAMIDDLIREGAPDGNLLRKHCIVAINDRVNDLAMDMLDDMF